MAKNTKFLRLEALLHVKHLRDAVAKSHALLFVLKLKIPAPGVLETVFRQAETAPT